MLLILFLLSGFDGPNHQSMHSNSPSSELFEKWESFNFLSFSSFNRSVLPIFTLVSLPVVHPGDAILIYAVDNPLPWIENISSCSTGHSLHSKSYNIMIFGIKGLCDLGRESQLLAKCDIQ